MSSYGRGIHNVRFNQDYGCFTVSMDSGVRIYNVEPLAEHGRIVMVAFGQHLWQQSTDFIYQVLSAQRSSFMGYDVIGGIIHAEMLGRTNLLALIAGGTTPKFPDRNVLVWDDLKHAVIFDIGLPSRVLSVRWRRDKLIAVLLNEIHVFYFPTSSSSTLTNPPPSPRHLTTVTTSSNPRGLCEVSSSVDNQVMVYPGRQKGTILLKDLGSLNEPKERGSGGQAMSESVCTTHSHDLTALALSSRGSMVATASTKGTIVRVHSTSSRDLVAEFRRGTDSANINCICFSLDSEYMLCSSDKATVHIFAIKDQTLNRKLSLPAVGILSRAVSSYTESQWGLAQFSLPKEGQCVCAFSGIKSVIALCSDGSFHKYTFTTDGNCTRDAFNMFLDMFDGQM